MATELGQGRGYIPADVRAVVSMLRSLMLDLSDSMQGEAREWLAEVNEQAQDRGQEWDGLREWMNDICREDGMPPRKVNHHE